MDHTGEESVPRQVSLLEAHMNQPTRVALLQRRDGYDSDHLEVGAELPVGYEPPLAAARRAARPARRCSRSSSAEEIDALTRTARPLTFGPMERIIVQGQEGDSLFVIVEGAVEVLLRRADGTEVNLGTRPNGAVIGEMSLLTGEPRSATVRAIDGALVYEVGRAPVRADPGRRGPELVDALTRAMVSRLRAQDETLGRYDAERRGSRSRAGCGGSSRSEERERVGAGGVRAERARRRARPARAARRAAAARRRTPAGRPRPRRGRRRSGRRP